MALSGDAVHPPTVRLYLDRRTGSPVRVEQYRHGFWMEATFEVVMEPDRADETPFERSRRYAANPEFPGQGV